MITVSLQEMLMIVVGFLVSLAMEYLPIAQSWFGNLKPWQKFLLILVFNVSVGIGTYIYADYGSLSWAEAGQAAWLAFIAFISSLSTHQADKFRLKLKVLSQ